MPGASPAGRLKPDAGTDAGPGRKYVRKKYLRAGPYEEGLARGAAGENTLAVLPAVRGRRVVALAAAECLEATSKQVLVLAPSRQAAGDTRAFLANATGLDQTKAITGKVWVKTRAKRWDWSDIACATPEMFLADLRRGMVSPGQFGLAVFVGAHRAVGRHACAEAARALAGAARILAVTDAMPRRPGRGAEMLEALRIVRVNGRPERGPAVEWVAVDLPPGMAAVRDPLRRALYDACATLRERGYGELEDPPLSRLEGILEAAGRGGGVLVEAARDAVLARCLLDTLEARGPGPFLYLCGWCRGRPGADTLLGRPQVTGAINAARRALAGGAGHPRMDRLADMLAAEPGRALVVAGPDFSVPEILRRLKIAGIPAAGLPADAGVTGLASMVQAGIIGGLREGRHRVLVSSSVEDACTGIGDGHLVPGDVDLVVCCSGGRDAARSARNSGAARVAVLVTRGSCEDPVGRAAVPLDWRMAKALEDNRRRVARERGGRAGAENPDWAGLAAQVGGQPEYRLFRRDGGMAAVGPAGAAGRFVDAAGPDGTVRALLGRIVGRRGRRVLYAAFVSRPPDGKPERMTNWTQMVPLRRLIEKLKSRRRNTGGVPIKKYEAHLDHLIPVADFNALMRALRDELQAGMSPEDRARNRLAHLVYMGIKGRDGAHLGLYATAEGLLYNGLAGGDCPEGHRMILKYKLVREICHPPRISLIKKYVKSVVDRVVAETGDRLELAE